MKTRVYICLLKSSTLNQLHRDCTSLHEFSITNKTFGFFVEFMASYMRLVMWLIKTKIMLKSLFLAFGMCKSSFEYLEVDYS